MQGRDGVVELIAAFVITPQLLAQRLLQRGFVDGVSALEHPGQGLVGVEHAAGITIGIGNQAGARLRREAGALQLGLATRQQGLHRRLVHGTQHMHGRARQQGGIHLERWVFSGRADESEQAGLDVGQEGVLLGLVETVHLVHEHDGAAPRTPCRLRLLDGLSDVLDASQHRRDGKELGIEGIGHQSRKRGFAHAGRAPQDHGMGLARLESHTQGLAWAQQVILPDDLVDGARAQALGQRRPQTWRLGCARTKTGRAGAARGVWQIEGETLLHGGDCRSCRATRTHHRQTALDKPCHLWETLGIRCFATSTTRIKSSSPLTFFKPGSTVGYLPRACLEFRLAAMPSLSQPTHRGPSLRRVRLPRSLYTKSIATPPGSGL